MKKFLSTIAVLALVGAFILPALAWADDPFCGRRHTWSDKQIFRGPVVFQDSVTSENSVLGQNLGPGNVWYVDSDVSGSGDGKTWDTALKTVTEAIAKAGDHDTIYVQKGVYDEGAVLNITEEGLRIIGMGTSGDIWGKTTLKASAANHKIITINANEVEIINLAFVQNNANIIIDVATTATTYKTHIFGCYFGGASTQTVGVAGSSGGTYDSVDVTVENSTFYQCVTGVDLNGTRCTIRDNVFLLSAGDTAIEVSQSGGNRPELRILDNLIRGANSTDTGVKFAATPTEALFTMDGNRVFDCATPVTESMYTSWYDGNFWGEDDDQYHSASADDKHPGRVFYCDANITATGLDGRSWKSAFKTLTEAVAAATTRDDTIYMAIGDYDEDAVVAVATQGLQIIGMGNKNDHQNKAMIYSGSASHLMTINAHEVLIDNIGFSMPDNAYDAVRVSTTMSAYKVTIQNCRFDAWNGEYAIHSGTTYDSPDLVVRNNLFRYWNTAAIYSNATRMRIEDNVFFTIATAIGIEHIPTTGGRPDTVIKDNVITGVNSTDTGIKITNSPSESTLTISGNDVTNCAVPITLSKYTSWYENNFWGIDDANYHQGWGRADCEKRGANGRIYYVDLNMSAAGDGLCWASAFDTVAAGLAAADAWIGTSGNRAWAKRCTVFSCHDGESETLTAAAEKTDLVGVGYDVGSHPKLTGNFTIGTAVNGFRIFNYGFVPTTTAPCITVPTGMHGFEMHNCETYKSQTVATTNGLLITNAREARIIGCRFNPDASDGRYATAGIGIAGGNSGMMEIRDCYISGAEGIDVNSNMAHGEGCIIANCVIEATGLCIDDNSDKFRVVNNTMISAADQATIGNCLDWNVAMAGNNTVTGSTGSVMAPSTDQEY